VAEPTEAGPTEADWAAAVDLLTDAREALLVAHINPDADTMGSALALGMVLRRRGEIGRAHV